LDTGGYDGFIIAAIRCRAWTVGDFPDAAPVNLALYSV
jgi:hypothetical protein